MATLASVIDVDGTLKTNATSWNLFKSRMNFVSDLLVDHIIKSHGKRVVSNGDRIVGIINYVCRNFELYDKITTADLRFMNETFQSVCVGISNITDDWLQEHGTYKQSYRDLMDQIDEIRDVKTKMEIGKHINIK